MKQLKWILLVSTMFSLTTTILSSKEVHAENLRVAAPPEDMQKSEAERKIVVLQHGESYTFVRKIFSSGKYMFKAATYFQNKEIFGLKHGEVENGQINYVAPEKFVYAENAEYRGQVGRAAGLAEYGFTITNYSSKIAFFYIGIRTTVYSGMPDFIL